MKEKIEKSDKQWKEQLTAEQFRVARRGGTERAFSGEYYKTKESGTYCCICCETPLFSSQHKFDSGTGWPSYWQPVAPDALEERSDRSFGMVRNETLCARCDAHLGHRFDDGPPPTGHRYCINSVSLSFHPSSN